VRDQGTFAFLFTDMEGSTPMVRRLAERWPGVLVAHRHLIATAVTEAGGDLAGSEGEGHLAVFSTADRALVAAIAGQQSLEAHEWPSDADVRVRMGLHAGVAEHREGDWVGLSLHIAARVCDAANGGQILLSAEAASLVERTLPPDARLEDRGAYFLKGLGDPVHLIELRHPALRGQGRRSGRKPPHRLRSRRRSPASSDGTPSWPSWSTWSGGTGS